MQTIILQLGTRLVCFSGLGLVTLISMGEIQDGCTMIKVYWITQVFLAHRGNNLIHVFTGWNLIHFEGILNVITRNALKLAETGSSLTIISTITARSTV